MEFNTREEFAIDADNKDELKKYREKFYFPFLHGRNALYFTGNSLGLQPRSTQDYVLKELEDWATFGVEGHFNARKPWLSYHEFFSDKTARLVGASSEEVVVMNQLTVNLHLLFVSFYRPTSKRYKIITEAKAFPSDMYAVESQVKYHGFKYEDAVIEVSPRAGEELIRHEDIIATIEKHKDEVALVFWGGVNYYTGQLFDMKAITDKAHEVGAIAGFDLAHAAGNIKLELGKWNVDFASWCSYKYLNSGPGGVSGVFINKKHASNKELPRFAGWWGHDKASRFKMEKGFNAIPTAEGWQMSNAPVLSMAAHLASLDMFDEVGMDKLCAKRDKLTAYLESMLDEINVLKPNSLNIITPRDRSQRGCQLSIVVNGKGREVFDELLKNSVITDWREPNVIRVAPVPMYNSYKDCYDFVKILTHILLH